MSRGGEEYHVRYGDYTAVVTQVGGGLRLLRHRDRDLLLGYDADAVRFKYRGALLAPWPNRVVDGTYRFAGRSYQLDITEPERHHALHGLVSWERFEPVEVTDASVMLRHRIVPRSGYPFDVALTVRYVVDDAGLTCTVTGRNVGSAPAPYGVAPHPYLVAGPGRVDEWRLELPAAQALRTTEDRLVPLGLATAADLGIDFSVGRTIGPAEIDHAFTSLRPDTDGRVRVRVLDDRASSGVECSWDPRVLPWVQVHTADLPDSREISRLGLAVEPMTCPPDAFNSGTDLVRLEPDREHVAAWTLRAI